MKMGNNFAFYNIMIDELISETECSGNGNYYILVDIAEASELELSERAFFALHMRKQGETSIWLPIMTKEGTFINQTDNRRQVLLQINGQEKIADTVTGDKLATFHLRGRGITEEVKQLNRLGQWPDYWIRRLDQMERFWQTKLQANKLDNFSYLFIEHFPYFLGLTENALQILGDLIIDFPDQLHMKGTITYERFNDDCFAFGKAPLTWVYDQPMRDVSEWLRSSFYKYDKASLYERIYEFLYSYSQVIQIDQAAVQLIYARLMFPITFFDSVESYYIYGLKKGQTTNLYNNLEQLIVSTLEYEDFLYQLNEIILKISGYSLKHFPDWLKKA